jgi:hypothetical protein
VNIADPATDLAISLLNGDGSVGDRWGADENAVGNIPKGLGFSTSDPGGFKDCSLSLARDIDKNWPDLRLLRALRIYGMGGRTAWEGSLQEIPFHHADDTSIAPGATGHVSMLDYDPSFAEIYIDADLTKWGEPSTQRRTAMLEAGYSFAGVEVHEGFQDAGTAGPAILFAFNNYGTATDVGEAWYYGNGVPLSKVLYDYIIPKAGADMVNQGTRLWTCENDLAAGAAGGTVHGAVANNGQEWGGGTALTKYFLAQSYYLGGLTGISLGDTYGIANPKVVGRHGLPLPGAWPNVGVYGSDVIADIVSRCAPDLNFTTGSEGSIAPTTGIIPHLVFSEGVKGSDAILGTNAYYQRSWGVYDDKTFFWHQPTSYRKRWRIRRSKGHGVDLLGPQAEDAVNGVVVTFTDPAGVSRVVGPPGCPTAYATSETLVDNSLSNPVNAAGIARKWGELKLGFVTTTSKAIEVGAAWMVNKLLSSQARGSVVVSGLVEDDETGTLHPAWAMRACDSVIVTDGDNIERGIIETNYDHDTRTCTCNLDTTPHKFEALQERMGIGLVGVTE